jgi:LemA protein
MGFATFIVLALVVVGVTYFVMIYNNLVRLKHNVAKAWANIDVLLKQRHDELPKLVETCKQYMKFEQALRATLGHLFALAEAYPDLKTNQSFQQLQARISSLENAIADRREFYNESVNVNNIRIEQFPDTLVASAFSFGPAQLLEFQAGEKADVDVKQLFNA